jgi:hypothetical protein
MIEIEVNKASAVYTRGRETLTSGRVGLKIKLVFSSDWQGLIKTAVCIGSGTTLATTVDSGGTFTVPHECMAEAGGQLKIGVCGMNADGTVVIPTVYCALGVIEEGAIPSGETGEEPTPSVFNQIAAYKYDPNTYEGVDLTEKFAEEIANYSDTWAWIQARIKAGNYTDLHVGDYIPFVTTNNVSLKAQIAGIDTYTGYGDTAIGHHMDFICEELWPTTHRFNKVNFNNGISNDVPYPWLASDLYYFVNSLSGTVPSSAVVGGGDGEAVNYTANGIYYYLPNALKAVIIQKRMMLPKRYDGSGVLSSDNGSGWANAGYLWLPTEWEVYGAPVWGNAGYGAVGTAVQYPLFAHGMRRMKKRNGSPSYWWLLSAYAGYSTLFASVSRYGTADANSTSYAGNTVPVCFRVG